MTAVEAIIQTVEGLAEELKAGVDALAILSALKPLFIEVGMNPAVLTDSQRAEIADRVHYALRKARLLEGVDL